LLALRQAPLPDGPEAQWITWQMRAQPDQFRALLQHGPDGILER